MEQTTDSLKAYLTWCLGIDEPGEAIVFARDEEHAWELLKHYAANAQPTAKLFDEYLPQALQRTAEDAGKALRLYEIGDVVRKEPGVLIIKDGYDVRFDD
jgi:hypothetical protein